MSAVEIVAVTKAFKNVKAVDDLSLTIPAGSVYGLIGPNGSGKSSTMRMIAGIFYPDAGAIRIFGKPRTGERSPEIGYLPEERGVYRKMRVKELLSFHGELRAGRKVDAEVSQGLARLGMDHCAERRVETLSKGMSQKIQFLAAVIPEPKLLILDEPFAGLDPVSADAMRRVILEMRARGSTVILSTHDMATAESMCDTICMIFRGRKVLDGTLASIQANYRSDTVSIDAAGGALMLEDLPDIEAVSDRGQSQQLKMRPGCDPQQVLRIIMSRTPVNSFAVIKPTLHDIFVRIAGPQPEEASRDL